MPRRLFLAMFVVAALSSSSYAEDSPLVFGPTGVRAPVIAGASSVWVISTDSSTTAEVISDTNSDGWVELSRAIDASATVWVVDIKSGRIMAGKNGSAAPAPIAFPSGLFVEERVGSYEHIVCRRTGPTRFLWVRPGTSAWQVTRGDGDAFDRDGLANGYTVFPVADFAGLIPWVPPPQKIDRGDVFLGIESPTTWFADKVDDHLVFGGPGVIGVPGDAGPTENTPEITFFVQRRGGTQGTISAKYATEDGTAVAGVDYEPTSGTLTYAPGEDFKQFKVRLKDNGFYSGSRKFAVRFFEPVGTTILRSATDITIYDNEIAPKPFFVHTSIPEGNAPIGTASLEIGLSSPSPRRLPVIAEWFVNSEGLPPQEGTVTFAPDETRKTITVSYKGDAWPNENRKLICGFRKVTGGDDQGGGAYIDVVDDDFAELGIGDVTVSERDSFVRVPVTATILGKPIFGRYTVTGGSATAGTDYVVSSGGLTSGYHVQIILIPLKDDSAPEPDEWFTVVLSDVTGATVVKNTGVVTIVDDEPASSRTPAIVIDDWAGVEGDTAQFTLHLSSAAQDAVSVTATIHAGTADARDYMDTSRTITIPAGATSTTFTVDLVPDLEQEPREQFTIELSNAVNATIARAVATGRIQDDDALSLPIVVIQGHSLPEYYFDPIATLRLSAPQPMPVTVTFETADETAKAGEDYERTWRQVIFEPGITELPLLVRLINDSIPEPNETFKIRLIAADGAIIATPSARCTIINDDRNLEWKRHSSRH